jgi:hypothetical protein
VISPAQNSQEDQKTEKLLGLKRPVQNGTGIFDALDKAAGLCYNAARFQTGHLNN